MCARPPSKTNLSVEGFEGEKTHYVKVNTSSSTFICVAKQTKEREKRERVGGRQQVLIAVQIKL